MLQDYNGAEWNAQAKVEYTWGRALSPAESQGLADKKVELINAGAITKSVVNGETGGRTMYWSTVADATTWLNFINSYTPPPTSATLTQI